MNEEHHNDLFNIRVNEVSKKYIRKLYTLGLVSFILNIIATAIIISISVFSFIMQDKSTDSFEEIFFFISPIYSIVYAAFSVIANYFYFTFLRKLKRSIVNIDENSFNLSFKYAYINTLLFLIGTIMGLIYIVFNAVIIIT